MPTRLGFITKEEKFNHLFGDTELHDPSVSILETLQTAIYINLVRRPRTVESMMCNTVLDLIERLVSVSTARGLDIPSKAISVSHMTHDLTLIEFLSIGNYVLTVEIFSKFHTHEKPEFHATRDRFTLYLGGAPPPSLQKRYTGCLIELLVEDVIRPLYGCDGPAEEFSMDPYGKSILLQ